MVDRLLISELNQEIKDIKLSLCLDNPVECVLEKGIKYIVERINKDVGGEL